MAAKRAEMMMMKRMFADGFVGFLGVMEYCDKCSLLFVVGSNTQKIALECCRNFDLMKES